MTGRTLMRASRAALLLSAVVCAVACTREQPPAPSSAGGLAPDFALQDVSGGVVRLSDLRGKVVLLEFWATWCPPCKAAVPDLIALADKYNGRDFVVLGIAMDEGSGAAERVKVFTAEMKINYPVVMGSEDIGRAYNVMGVPASFLIDKQGRIASSHVGYIENFREVVSGEAEGLL